MSTFRVVIHGASDDLAMGYVSEDGDTIQTGECSQFNTPIKLLVRIDGEESPVWLTYNNEGEWEVSYTPEGSESVSFEGAGNRPDLCAYSETLTIDVEAVAVEILTAEGDLLS